MVHESAAKGYQAESETYAKVRPSYHGEILDLLVANLNQSLGDGLVIDLGAGTGIATAALLERGVDVLAVEPVPAMREQLAASLPAVAVLEGTAERLPVDDGAAAAVVVAQAFHWFDHGPALDEIARALTPGGCLATMWNVKDESVPWMAAYTAIHGRIQGDTPRYRTMIWRQAIEEDPRFSLIEEQSRPNPQRSNADHTVGRFLSTSFVASKPPAQRQDLEAEIRALVAPLGEEYNFPYFSEIQIWRYRPLVE